MKFDSINQKVEKDYDHLAQAFDQSRVTLRWPEVEAMIATVKSGEHILDIGCGTGRLISLFEEQGAIYHGIDLSQGLIDQAKKHHPEADVQKGSMTKLPYDDASMDHVFMIASFHHLIDPQDRLIALQEAKRVLKPGGTVFITVKAFWQTNYLSLFFHKAEGFATLSKTARATVKWNDLFWPWSWRQQAPVYRYYHAFTRSELKNIVQESGLVIDSLSYVKNGQKVKWYEAKNLVCVAKKMVS